MNEEIRMETEYIQWDCSEILQEKYPHLEWGWDGFVPVILYRGLYDEI